MRDAALAGAMQRRADLPQDIDGQLDVQRSLANQQLHQVLAGDVFLGDKMNALQATDLVNLHDVGVNQRGGGLGFVVKPTYIGLFLGERLA